MQGYEFGKLRNRAQAVTNASGEDMKEVMHGAVNMSKAFDISAKEAMGMVHDGFVVGANVNGEFLETLREYPTLLQS